ncbi:MAG: hypothetical protein KF729_17465 [Sandaracinaceae bacterium]|nr:hypothetical protein [Sandaracinaceae bacterium]
MRWMIAVALLAGCSCEEEPELSGEGHVRCHLAPPPEGERTHGSLRLDFDARTLAIEGLGDVVRVAVAAGPLEGEVPDAELAVVLGGPITAPPRGTRALVLAIAGGADEWAAWTAALAAAEGVVDATGLRLVRAGPVELVPVPGAPLRYTASNEACGLEDSAPAAWTLAAPPRGVTRVLAAWAAPEARGLLGLPAGAPVVARIRERAHAGPSVFAWPREDPEAARPASGPWAVRADGAREPPGWTLYEASAAGWRRLEPPRARR